jgi:hypothetical protein
MSILSIWLGETEKKIQRKRWLWHPPLPGISVAQFFYLNIAMENLSIRKPGGEKIHKWIFITGRLLALSAALGLMIYSVSWASDGSRDTATILFIAGIIFFIPFILFGRKMKEIKKVKKYKKRSNAIIGWRYSGY